MTQAILLGAGRGSRLDAERGAGPKWMLEVEGQPLAQHLVNVLHAHDVTNILLVRGALGGTVLSPSVAYADVLDSPNMLHTMQQVRHAVRDDVIIAYCDLLLEPRVVRQLLKDSSDAAVVVDRNWASLFALREDDPISIAESCQIVDGRLTEIGQPLVEGRWPEAQYVGLMRFSQKGFRELMTLYDELEVTTAGQSWRNAKSFSAAYITDFLQAAIDHGIPLTAVTIEGGWLEFDTPRDLALARRLPSEPKPLIFDPATLPSHPSVLSAGGVAVRGLGASREVLLVGSGEAGGWRVPKGMLESGEAVEVAARREVQEETGVPVAIDGSAQCEEWSYEYGGRRWRERCFFYPMAALEDATPTPDGEHSVAAWVSGSVALAGMRFPEERRVVERVLS
ncbi:NUDIX domain-containing protein [Aquibium microcysteis]|uniref:NUDIX domain-containing protein n=1 Tax=Aquibium microcysteis TaxID=675281 RepID=UPI00165D1560|nr:NUDIX domain-containing protein [Aquibium microcysteis]